MEMDVRSAIGLISRFFEALRTQEPLFAVTSRHLTRFIPISRVFGTNKGRTVRSFVCGAQDSGRGFKKMEEGSSLPSSIFFYHKGKFKFDKAIKRSEELSFWR